MNFKLIGQMVALGAVGLLSACGSTQRANPCVAWAAYNGAYVVQYTAKPGSDAACVASQGLNGDFDTLSAEIYDLGDTTQVAFYSGWTDFDSFFSTTSLIQDFATDVDANFSRVPELKLAIANFDSKEVGADDTCTVGATSTATSPDGGVTYKLSNVVFQEDANVQGTAFKADAEVHAAGCTASYSIVALAPPAPCGNDDDCLPVPDFAAGRPRASGIASSLRTYCEKTAQGALNYSAYWNGDPDRPGLCFLAAEFPSLCPDGAILGGPDCPVGK